MISKADLHVHTKYSFDGLSEPEDLVNSAANAGISVLAITDHNNLDGAFKAVEAAKNYPVAVVVGEEIYTGEGELIGLFLKEYIPPRLGLFETIDAIREQGGVVIVPHPFNWTTLKETVTVRKMEKIHPYVDGIETINASWFGKRARKKAPVMNTVYGLAEIGSSDAHFFPHVGHAYTNFPGSTAEDLKTAILNRTTSAGMNEIFTRNETFWMISENFRKYGANVKTVVKRRFRKQWN